MNYKNNLKHETGDSQMAFWQLTIEKVLHYAWLNASLQRGFRNPIDVAIVSSHPEEKEDFEVQSEVPYDFIRKRLTIQVSNASKNPAISKGAVSQALEVCTQMELKDGTIVSLKGQLDQILSQYQSLSAEGFRTLGVGYISLTTHIDFSRRDEKEMIFLGFIILLSPASSARRLEKGHGRKINSR